MKGTKITAIAGILLALLTMGLNQSCTDCGSMREDPNALEKLREILTVNIALNTKYETFRENQTADTPFSEIFSTLNSIAKEKGFLQYQIEQLKVPKRFSLLSKILKESLISDQRLLITERESLKHTIGFVNIMESLPEVKDEGQSDEEKRIQAIQVLSDFRKRMNEWREESEALTALEKTYRLNSIRAIKMLNEELKKLYLPYHYENIFKEENEADQKTKT